MLCWLCGLLVLLLATCSCEPGPAAGGLTVATPGSLNVAQPATTPAHAPNAASTPQRTGTPPSTATRRPTSTPTTITTATSDTGSVASLTTDPAWAIATGKRPLHEAALAGSVADVEPALGEGGDVNATVTVLHPVTKYFLDVTPLNLAASENGNPAILRALLDTEAKNEYRSTSPDVADSEGNSAAIELLRWADGPGAVSYRPRTRAPCRDNAQNTGKDVPIARGLPRASETLRVAVGPVVD